jgi:glycosyltransferase involved in cell wall biosynthesis
MNKLTRRKNCSLSPLITIITVCYNSEKTIAKTIESVIAQKYKNIEFIIIDGKSTDKTMQILDKYKSYVTKIISEKDYGIYDAFNKGLTLCNGDLIGFVNSDDQLTPEATKILVEYYNKYPKKDFFFGAVKKHWAILHGYKPWKIYFSWGFYSSHSTGFFIKKEAAKKIGFYNTKYKYSADYDYFYRMIVKEKLSGIGTKKNELFGIFNRGGFSSKINFYDHMCECTKIRIDNGQNKIVVLLTFIFKFLKNLKRL